MVIKMDKTGSNKDIIKQVLNYIGKYKIFLVFSIIMAAISVILTLYIPILTGEAVDCIIGPNEVDFSAVFEILNSIAHT